MAQCLYCRVVCGGFGFRAESRASPGPLVLAQAEFVLDRGDGHQKINEPYWSLCVGFISIITHRLLMGGGEGFCGPIFFSRSHPPYVHTWSYTHFQFSFQWLSVWRMNSNKQNLLILPKFSVNQCNLLPFLSDAMCSGLLRMCLI